MALRSQRGVALAWLLPAVETLRYYYRNVRVLIHQNACCINTMPCTPLK